jgi:hypothetical protein
MLLLNNILQCVNLLIQFRFNINGAPIVVYAHSVKSVVFLRGSLCQAPSSWDPRRAAPHGAASPTASDHPRITKEKLHNA